MHLPCTSVFKTNFYLDVTGWKSELEDKRIVCEKGEIQKTKIDFPVSLVPCHRMGLIANGQSL